MMGKNLKALRKQALANSSEHRRMRTAYWQWLEQGNFDYFIVLKFRDGFAIHDRQAMKLTKLFLNKLDRRFVNRGELEKHGKRLERMVFIGHGITGENTHINLYMNNIDGLNYRQFRHAIITTWENTTLGDADVQISDNSIAVNNYSAKELKLNDADDCKEIYFAEASYLSGANIGTQL